MIGKNTSFDTPLLFLIFLLTTQLGFSQIQFIKTYGGSSDGEQGHCGKQTADGGYIVAGSAPTSLFSIIKTDAKGDTLWTKSVPNKDFYSVDETLDGYIFSGGPGIYLLKTDFLGTTQWDETFSTSSNYDYGYAVKQTTDNGFIITGQKNYNSITYDGDICLIKTDSMGNKKWMKLLTSGLTDCAGRSIEPTSDGGYIICGHSYNQLGSGSGYDICLLKTDVSGNIQWNKYFGSLPILTAPDRGYSVKQTNDDGYILCGTYSEMLSQRGYLIRTDKNGDTLWTKTYGSNSDGYGFKSVDITSDSGFIMAGFASTDLIVLKTKNNGEVLWTKLIDGSDNTQANGIEQTTDGGYAVFGFTAAQEFSNNLPNSYDQLLVKMDSLGNTSITTNIVGSNFTNQLYIYPNPASSTIILQLNSDAPTSFQYTIKDLTSKTVFQNKKIEFGNKLEIDVSNLRNGIYFITVNSNVFSSTFKFIKQ